jgi:hypothetical protein
MVGGQMLPIAKKQGGVCAYGDAKPQYFVSNQSMFNVRRMIILSCSIIDY